MIRYAELQVAASTLDAEKHFQWRIWIRRTPIFKDYGSFFTDLDARLTAAAGTIIAKALNVLAPKIEQLDGELGVIGGDEDVRLSIPDERNALIVEGILALYDSDVDLITIIMSEGYVVMVGEDGTAESAIIAVGQMSYCSSCGGTYYGCLPVCRYAR